MCADCCKRCLKRFSKQTVTPCQENSCLLPGMDRMVYEVEDPDVNAKLLEWIKWDKVNNYTLCNCTNYYEFKFLMFFVQ